MKRPVKEDHIYGLSEYQDNQDYIEDLNKYIDYLELDNIVLERGFTIDKIDELRNIGLLGTSAGSSLGKTLLKLGEALPDSVITADENGMIVVSPKAMIMTDELINNISPNMLKAVVKEIKGDVIVQMQDNSMVCIGHGGLEFKPIIKELNQKITAIDRKCIITPKSGQELRRERRKNE